LFILRVWIVSFELANGLKNLSFESLVSDFTSELKSVLSQVKSLTPIAYNHNTYPQSRSRR
jgi:hypothetical protein